MAHQRRVASCRAPCWLIGLCALACASPTPVGARPAATPAVASERATPAAPASGFGAGFRIIEAKGQGLEFPLPDPAGWRLDKRERYSWVARHRQSSSELLARAWRLDAIARPEDCERDARQWRKALPEPAPAELIEASERTLAGAYRARVSVGIRALGGSPERLYGYALGFGSDARSCLLLAFATTAAGAGARTVVAERLALITGSVFERARRLDIEGRVSVPRL